MRETADPPAAPPTTDPAAVAWSGPGVLLALDTATAATVAVAVDATGRAAVRRHDPAMGGRPEHAERVLALAHAALAALGQPLEAVGRVAVGLGPGSFTGLRVGIATARGLALGLDAELVGVPVAEVLARTGRRVLDERDQRDERDEHDEREGLDGLDGGEGRCAGVPGGGPAGARPEILVLVDGRRRELFVARAGRTGHAGALTRVPVDRLHEHLDDLAAGSLAVGDGVPVGAAALADAGLRPGPAHLDGLDLARCGAEAPAAGGRSVVPLYGREPDARPPHPDPEAVPRTPS